MQLTDWDDVLNSLESSADFGNDLGNEPTDKLLNLADEAVGDLKGSDLWNDTLDVLDDGLDVQLDGGCDLDSRYTLDGLVCRRISIALQVVRCDCWPTY